MKLIQSMDKYNSTTVKAVEVRSVDALELQSRQFTAMPKINPQTNAQYGLGQSQAKLDKLYADAARLANAFQKWADREQAGAQVRKDTLNKELMIVIQSTEKTLEKMQQAEKEWQKKMLESAQVAVQNNSKLSEAMTAVSRDTKQIAQISTVTY